MFGREGWIIGQCIAALAVVVGFISFRQKTPERILVCEIISATLFTLHYLLIGAMTAVALNLLAVVQCVTYYIRERRGGKGKALPLIFTALTVASGVLTWEGWHSAFIVSGLAVYSLSIALCDAQGIRRAMLFKSPACLVYNIAAASIMGTAYECAVLCSSIIGLVKNRKRLSKRELRKRAKRKRKQLR